DRERERLARPRPLLEGSGEARPRSCGTGSWARASAAPPLGLRRPARQAKDAAASVFASTKDPARSEVLRAERFLRRARPAQALAGGGTFCIRSGALTAFTGPVTTFGRGRRICRRDGR